MENTGKCNNLDGFLIYHSFGGGTGSGFSSLLYDRLSIEYPKSTKFNFSIFPSQIFNSSNCEIYNTILSAHSIIDHMNCCFSFDNKSLLSACKHFLDVDKPNFRSLNEIVCQVSSSITNPNRHNEFNDRDSTLNIFRSYNELFPFQRIKFSVCSYAPLHPVLRSCAQYDVEDLTKNVFYPESVLIDCDCNNLKHKYISCGCFYRGDVCSRNVNDAIKYICEKRRFRFLDYNSGNSLKIGMNYNTPKTIHDSIMTKYLRSLCLIANTTAISDKWSQINQEFNLLYEKRNFVHSYVCEGMEQHEFKEAQDDLVKLVSDYNDLGKNNKENEEEEDL